MNNKKLMAKSMVEFLEQTSDAEDKETFHLRHIAMEVLRDLYPREALCAATDFNRTFAEYFRVWIIDNPYID